MPRSHPFRISDFVQQIVGGLFVAGRISKPVNQLAATAGAVVKGNFDTELNQHVENDEIGVMVDSFDEMRENLDAVFEIASLSLPFRERCRHLTTASILYTDKAELRRISRHIHSIRRLVLEFSYVDYIDRYNSQ